MSQLITSAYNYMFTARTASASVSTQTYRLLLSLFEVHTADVQKFFTAIVEQITTLGQRIISMGEQIVSLIGLIKTNHEVNLATHQSVINKVSDLQNNADIQFRQLNDELSSIKSLITTINSHVATIDKQTFVIQETVDVVSHGVHIIKSSDVSHQITAIEHKLDKVIKAVDVLQTRISSQTRTPTTTVETPRPPSAVSYIPQSLQQQQQLSQYTAQFAPSFTGIYTPQQ